MRTKLVESKSVLVFEGWTPWILRFDDRGEQVNILSSGLALRTSCCCVARTHSCQRRGFDDFFINLPHLIDFCSPQTHETSNCRWPSEKLKAALSVKERRDWRGIEKVSWLKNLLLWVVIAWACQNLLTVFYLLITYDCRNVPLKPVVLLFLGGGK